MILYIMHRRIFVNFFRLIIPFTFAFSICLSQPSDDFQVLRTPAVTTGGLGGEVIKVTNLNTDGPGSFFEAVRKKGKRTVVFEVGGVIDLKNRLVNIRTPFLTIAGQTAPSPGITLINGGVIITTHDVIVQHIRIRTGTSGQKPTWSLDALSTKSAYNVIIDHCSLSWSVDENLSASGPRFEGKTPNEWRKNTSHRITFSNNIIAEGLSNASHAYGEHSKGTLIHDNVTDVLIISNLYANNVDRNPYLKGGTAGVIVNNYINNPVKAAIRFMLSEREWRGYPYQTGKWSIVGNVMQHGVDSKDIPLLDIRNGPCQIYLEDNKAFRVNGAMADIVGGDVTKVVKEKPIWFDNLKVIKANQVKDYLVQNAGARPWDRDEHDKRVIQQILNRKGRIIDSELEVGGYPKPKETREKFKIENWDMKTLKRIK